MKHVFEETAKEESHLSACSIESTALKLHNQMLLAYKSGIKTGSGFYRGCKKIKSLMPLPFTGKSSMAGLIMKKVRGLRSNGNKQGIVSSFTLKPAHGKRIRLRRYIYRLVRRR